MQDESVCNLAVVFLSFKVCVKNKYLLLLSVSRLLVSKPEGCL